MRTILSFCSTFLVLFVLLTAMPNQNDYAVYDGFIRLHVLANSDSESDQTVKLEVRDALLGTVAGLTEGCVDVSEALEMLEAHADTLSEKADAVLRQNGFDYGAQVRIGREYYPSRTYDDVTLPAGVYLSTRIVLGEGEGHNWWCILFPPLCTDTARAVEKMRAAGLTQNQIRILTDGDHITYKLKFRSLELIQSLWQELQTLLDQASSSDAR